MNKKTTILQQIITDMQDRYNANRDSAFPNKAEIYNTIMELRELAGFDRDECSDCGAIGSSMVNGACYECTEGRDERASDERSYQIAKGF
jgi:hypothetical protein